MTDEIARKASQVRVVILDVDGVLTDGTAYYMDDGSEMVAFNVQDGSGIKYLHRAGLQTALITGRSLAAVRYRVEVLGIDELVQGAKRKMPAYEELKKEMRFSDEEACYAGDDLPDLPLIRRVGLGVAVKNSRPELKEEADLVTEHAGGHGAVRELAEFILKARGDWDGIMERYLP